MNIKVIGKPLVSYLTEGKVYSVVRMVGDIAYFIDDQGDTINALIGTCHDAFLGPNATWEIVEE